MLINNDMNYTANALNQYTVINAAPLTHDPDGNLLTHGAFTYAYDAENRLACVSDTSGNIVSNFYDHTSRRVMKWTPDATTTFLYDGWNLVTEIISTPHSTLQTTNLFVWGKDLSGTLQGAGGIGGLLATCWECDE